MSVETDGRRRIGAERGRRQIDDLFAVRAQYFIVPLVRGCGPSVEDDADIAETRQRRQAEARVS